VQRIVTDAARRLTGSDGTTLVLREGDECFYAEEAAIGPLWKGRRFPLSTCISGWSMLHRAAVAIPDIYADERVPWDAYRPTFVRSLAMVPVKAEAPIGAIGSYWSTSHTATAMELQLLETLADAAAQAIENVRLVNDLEVRVAERTSELRAVNDELEAFAYSVSHDLRGPLRALDGFSNALLREQQERLDETGRHYLERIGAASRRMGDLIDALLTLSRVTRREMKRERVDLSALVGEAAAELQAEDPARRVEWMVGEGLAADGDAHLLGIAIENLLANAWKFTSPRGLGRIEIGRLAGLEPKAPPTFFVRDNGVGFDMAYADKLFAPFQRLHATLEFPGTGIGLATVQRIVVRHGGRIWAEAEVDQGATFYFTLGGGT
jgi:hypothetical protein